METLRYAYRANKWAMLLAGMFFAACTLALWAKARSNDRGVIINHLIELDMGKATIFYWLLCASSAGFVLTAIVRLVSSFRGGPEVVVDARGVTAPKGMWSGADVHVPFRTITDLQLRQVQREKFLIIIHNVGKLTIRRSMLPHKDDFDTLVAAIAGRMRS